MEKLNGDTPGGNNGQQPSTPGQPDTPPNPQGGTPPSEDGKGGKKLSDLESVNQTLQQFGGTLNEIRGRLTKVEQRGKAGNLGLGRKTREQHFTFQPNQDDPPTEEDIALEQERETTAFEKGVFKNFIKNPKYQKLLDQDKTLADLLDRNPMALLEETPADAEDAINQLESILDGKLPTIPAGPTGEDTPPPAPNAGPANPPENTGQPKSGDEPAKPKEVKTVEQVGKGLLTKITGDPRLRGGTGNKS